MKNLNHLLSFTAFICTCAFLLSCGDDDEKSSISIVGKWQVESRELFDCPNDANNNVLQCSTSPASTDCGTWEFKSGGNYTVTYTGGSYTQQYEPNASGQLDLCYNSVCTPFLYIISGNKLTITEGDFSTSCLRKYILVKI